MFTQTAPPSNGSGGSEPNHLMAPSLYYVKDVACTLEKIAADQRDSQYGPGERDVDHGAFPHVYEEGLLPAIAPRYARFLYDCGEGSFCDIVPWGSSILLGAYEMFRFTGSRRLLMENYETAKKDVEYLYPEIISALPVRSITSPATFIFFCHGLGDWGIEQNRGESRENIETAYLIRDLQLLSLTAGWLGRQQESAAGMPCWRIRRARNTTASCCSGIPRRGSGLTLPMKRTASHPRRPHRPSRSSSALCRRTERAIGYPAAFCCCAGKASCAAGRSACPTFCARWPRRGSRICSAPCSSSPTTPSYYRFIEHGETTMPEFWRDDSQKPQP